MRAWQRESVTSCTRFSVPLGVGGRSMLDGALPLAGRQGRQCQVVAGGGP